jgi:CBS domain-containing protein
MNVEHLMTRDVEVCTPDSTLTDAAMIMWRRDCGIVPVVKPGTRDLVGVITDRDVCMAAATRHASTDDLFVRDLIGGHIYTCGPADSVRNAAHRMAEAQVRRIPVTDRAGMLLGMLSLNDLALAAEKTERRGEALPTYTDAIGVLKAVSAHRLPAPVPESKSTSVTAATGEMG